MSHIRIDPITKQAVIIAAERVDKPTDYIEKANEVDLEKSKIICPFCVGREHIVPNASNTIYDNNSNWIVRIVPNKYPIISETSINEMPNNNNLFKAASSNGFHDVIIEHPSHEFNFYNAEINDLAIIFDAVMLRLKDLSNEKNMKYSLHFKNFGAEAGASLYHSHSQMITTAFIPTQIKIELEGSLEYYNSNNICAYCDIIEEEKKLNKRVIEENEEFIAISPFASRSPYQIYILPKNHFCSIIESNHSNIKFANILKNIFKRIYNLLGNISFNYVLHTIPNNLSGQYSHSHHWFLDLIPKMNKLAGYELGSGILINSISPEDATENLKKAIK